MNDERISRPNRAEPCGEKHGHVLHATAATDTFGVWHILMLLNKAAF